MLTDDLAIVSTCFRKDIYKIYIRIHSQELLPHDEGVGYRIRQTLYIYIYTVYIYIYIYIYKIYNIYVYI